jgi:Protein of unknown function (DUF2950)
MPSPIAKNHSPWPRRLALAATFLSIPATVWSAAAAQQQTFASPEAGIEALVQAVKTNDQVALHAMLGPDSSALISSGDSIEDAHSRKIFLHVYGVAHKVVHQDDTHAVLVIGRAKRLMPIPLVKQSNGWCFDTARGEAQIIQHRIDHNEENAMQTVLAIVYAERQYAADHPHFDGSPVYTAKFRSSPGLHDGLYWPAKANVSPSLLGVMLSNAVIEGYPPPGASNVKPYQGYLYRITPDWADSGIDSHGAIEGFTVVAYPAHYGVSGTKTFFVHVDGVVYGKDLGVSTTATVFGMQHFSPSSGWQISRPVD